MQGPTRRMASTIRSPAVRTGSPHGPPRIVNWAYLSVYFPAISSIRTVQACSQVTSCKSPRGPAPVLDKFTLPFGTLSHDAFYHEQSTTPALLYTTSNTPPTHHFERLVSRFKVISFRPRGITSPIGSDALLAILGHTSVFHQHCPSPNPYTLRLGHGQLAFRPANPEEIRSQALKGATHDRA